MGKLNFHRTVVITNNGNKKGRAMAIVIVGLDANKAKYLSANSPVKTIQYVFKRTSHPGGYHKLCGGEDAFTISGADTIGKWIKFPVSSGNFYFSKTRMFVLELAEGIPRPWNRVCFMQSTPYNVPRYLLGYRDSAYSGIYYPYVMDLGFDIQPTEVSPLSNINTMSLFPNPCSDGHFNVSFDTKQSVQNASITVRTVTGQEVYKQSYRQAGNSFFKEVKLGNAAKGLYFMELRADGERIVRRVVLE